MQWRQDEIRNLIHSEVGTRNKSRMHCCASSIQLSSVTHRRARARARVRASANAEICSLYHLCLPDKLQPRLRLRLQLKFNQTYTGIRIPRYSTCLHIVLAPCPEKPTLCCAVLFWSGMGVEWVYAPYLALPCRLECCISKDWSRTSPSMHPTDISSRSGSTKPRCRASMTCLLRVTLCGNEEGAMHSMLSQHSLVRGHRERDSQHSLSPLEQNTYRSTRPTSRPRGIRRRIIQRRESKMQLSRLALTCV
jgi:hypothetical protein